MEKKNKPQEVKFSGVIVQSPETLDESPKHGLVTGDEISVYEQKGSPMKAKFSVKGQLETVAYEHLRGFMQLLCKDGKVYHLLRLSDGRWFLILFKGHEPSKRWQMVNTNLNYAGNSSYFDAKGKMHRDQTSIYAARTFNI